MMAGHAHQQQDMGRVGTAEDPLVIVPNMCPDFSLVSSNHDFCARQRMKSPPNTAGMLTPRDGFTCFQLDLAPREGGLVVILVQQ